MTTNERTVHRVLRWFVERGDRGGTVDACEVDLGLLHQQVSPRVHDLEKAGCLVKSEVRQRTRSKKAAAVYRYVDGSVYVGNVPARRGDELRSLALQYLKERRAAETTEAVKTSILRLLDGLNRYL